MKKLTLLFSLILITGCARNTNPTVDLPLTQTLTLYTYDSLSAEYGLLPKITDQFEQAYNAELNIVSFPDSGAMVNQLLAEKNDPQADVVLGIDNSDVARYEAEELFLEPTPFDYGYVGFVYDTEALTFTEPISLESLAEDEAYRNKIIITQPGLSSPGTQLLLWGNSVFGEDANEFWSALEAQVLTVAPDWNTAYYSMFLNGEAPIVLSYLTSPAYHIDQESTDRYQAIPISDDYLQQTEYVARVNRPVPSAAAQDFITYMQSASVQNQIATTQWMFPIDETATLPEAYNQIITPSEDQILTLADTTIATNYTSWLQEWNGIFGR